MSLKLADIEGIDEMILKIITEFHNHNQNNIKNGLKELTPLDLDKRLTLAGYNLNKEKVKKIYNFTKGEIK